MWSKVLIPVVPGWFSGRIVTIEKYCVKEGDEILPGETIAFARTRKVHFKIQSNYHGRILSVILPEGSSGEFDEPMATLELLQDPVNGLDIAYFARIDDQPAIN